jgi:hypothetical protein
VETYNGLTPEQLQTYLFEHPEEITMQALHQAGFKNMYWTLNNFYMWLIGYRGRLAEINTDILNDPELDEAERAKYIAQRDHLAQQHRDISSVLQILSLNISAEALATLTGSDFLNRKVIGFKLETLVAQGLQTEEEGLIGTGIVLLIEAYKQMRARGYSHEELWK